MTSAPTRERKPPWFKAPFPSGERFGHIKDLLRAQSLHTVCEEARCPNIGECFNDGTATFMILGDICTRACGYCAVHSGRPAEGPDPLEPLRLAQTVAALELDYAVITSVNRDDLDDGGASAFAACIRAVHHARPTCDVEVLIPDFMGNVEALRAVLDAGPVVLNHNTETVPRLYRGVRSKGDYQRTLDLFRHARELAPGVPRKTGIMLGLGETAAELEAVFDDLREAGVTLLTLGQYLRPTPKHLPVVDYVHPDEFARLREVALGLGFHHVESGPLVRSSYHARAQAQTA
ncbi:MAG: lipoyl synthase [Dehalococcoidia bacterium]|nr:MAG: lipoyl synthase [Dehalococcoidia bacterium]